MSWLSPNPGEEVIAQHVAQITSSASGAADGGQVWALTQLDDGSNPALSVRNVNASGTALRVYKTVTAVDTDLLKVTNADSMVTVKNLTVSGTYTQAVQDVSALTGAIMQRQQVNAKDWGVLDDGSDCTAAINTILDTYRDLGYAPGRGLDLYFPSGFYSVGKIDATGINNVYIHGVPGGTYFFADKMTSPGVVWDFTGSSNLDIRGLGVAGALRGQSTAPTHIPTCGFFFSSSDAASGQDSNANYYEFLVTYGYFSKAAIVLNDTVDTTFVWCHPLVTPEDTPNFWLSSGNSAGITSAYLTPSATQAAMANITFVNVGGQGIRMDDNTSNVNFFGGSIDGTTCHYCVRMAGTTHKIGFYNCQLNAEPNTLTGGGAILVEDGTHYGFTIETMFTPGITEPDQAIIKASDAAIFKTPRWVGFTTGDVSTNKILDHDTASPTSTIVIEGGQIDCGGGDLAPGGTIKSVIISQVGTYTRASGADENDCLFITPNSYPSGGSGISLQNNALRVGDGAVGTPSYSFTGDFDTGLYRSASGTIAFAGDGAQRAIINASGLQMASNTPIIPAAVSGTPAQHGLYQGNVVKGWVVYDGVNAGIVESFNVASVTDGGAAGNTVAWDRDFAAGTYCVQVTHQNDPAPSAATTFVGQINNTNKLAGSVVIRNLRASDGAQTDVNGCHVLAIGGQ